jgi:hypothetical protein
MELLTILQSAAARCRSRVQSASGYTMSLVALFMTLTSSLTVAAESEPLEYAVKAAYLSKFGLYVEWPNSAFTSPSSALSLCVAGEDPFGPALDKAAADQRIGGRAIVVRRLKTIGRDSGCHILYVGGSDAPRAQLVMDAVRGSSVLTVSDARGADTGAIINFVIKDNRVRFDIDEEVAAQNRLSVSSKLLGLALNVRRKQSQEAR